MFLTLKDKRRLKEGTYQGRNFHIFVSVQVLRTSELDLLRKRWMSMLHVFSCDALEPKIQEVLGRGMFIPITGQDDKRKMEVFFYNNLISSPMHLMFLVKASKTWKIQTKGSHV